MPVLPLRDSRRVRNGSDLVAALSNRGYGAVSGVKEDGGPFDRVTPTLRGRLVSAAVSNYKV